MIDVALAIEMIYPDAVWHGSVTANTREAFDVIEWRDERAKPTWDQLTAAWEEHFNAA